MKHRGFGSVFRAKYRDKKTGETRECTTWTIQYVAVGKVVRERTRLVEKAEALRLLRERVSHTTLGRPAGPAVDRTSFEDLAQFIVTDYRINERRSMRDLELRLKHLREHLGDRRASHIDELAIGAFVSARLDAGAKNATVNRELAALKRAFRLAARAQRVARVPYIAMLKENNARRGFFEPAEFQAVVEHLHEDLRAVAVVAYVTGWRVSSEILTRQWRHVDFDAGWLRLEPGETKNREGRMFPLTPELRVALLEQRARTDALEHESGRVVPWVFWRRRAPGVQEDGAPIGLFRKAWIRACAAAGVPGRIPHDFRRTAVRNMERAGVPRSAAMALVGHKTESIYRRYAITDEAMLRESAEKLATLHRVQLRDAPRIVRLSDRQPCADDGSSMSRERAGRASAIGVAGARRR